MAKMSKSQAHIIKRLIEVRSKYGLSQRELAKLFYVTNGTVSLWESGERPLQGAALRLLEILEDHPKVFFR